MPVHLRTVLYLALLLGFVSSFELYKCSEPPQTSCSEHVVNLTTAPDSNGLLDPCCVVHPGGLFSFTWLWGRHGGEWVPGPLKVLKSVEPIVG